MGDIGHNSKVGGIAADQFAAFVGRRERLEEEKVNLQEDIKHLNAEVKALGYDLKIFNEVIKRRKMTREARDEHDELLHTYESIFD